MTDGGGFSKKSGSGGGFESLGLSPDVLRGVKRMGFRVPTPVQRKSLPVCLSGKDAVVMARTGSGKTAAFVLTVLERILLERNSGTSSALSTSSSSIQALILSPTRELALQTLKVTNTLATFTGLTAVGIVGGDSIEGQFNTLASKPDIVVATPGRLSHLLREIPDLTLLNCRTLVLDEADRLLEMGFALQLREICSPKFMPSPHNGGRQTMLFSATLPKSLVELTKSGVVMSDEPEVVRLEKEANVSEELRVGFITCRSQDKDAALLHLVRDVCTTIPAVKERLEIARRQLRHSTSGSPHQRIKSSKPKSTTDTKGGEIDGNPDEETSGSKNKKEGLVLIFAATRHHVEFICTLLKLHDISATHIYGTMDHEARQAALSNFRRGIHPVLVVTDVAARGIDVPLIDVVIHHSFPASPKLFVHRSGRAARAGRIGYCFSLVDPEELAYMTDLHLFLGRPLSNKWNDEKAVNNEGYPLQDMVPAQVQYGTVPESVLTVEVENISRLLSQKVSGGHAHDIENLVMLHRTCLNAMKQFRKTRPDASRQGIKRAKKILTEENVTATAGLIHVAPHPVLLHWERNHHNPFINNNSTGKDGSESKTKEERQQQQKLYWENKEKRDEFLKAMSSFRPKETIFESQIGSAGSKKGPYSSQVDKSKSSSNSEKHVRLEGALTAMKDMRRQMKLARSKGEAMVVAGTDAAELINQHRGSEERKINEGDSPTDDDPEEKVNSALASLMDNNTPTAVEGKIRVSKAERKRSRKGGNAVAEAVKNKEGGAADVPKTKSAIGEGGFRDNEHFIDVERGYDERSRTVEASLQPSADTMGRKDLRTNALRLEESMLDLVGDENADMVKHHRIMRWDKSKRKYIQTTLAAATSESYSKRIRLESGQSIKVNDDKAKLGQLYEKWQKKTNQSIGRTGVFDDEDKNNESNGRSQKYQNNRSAGEGKNKGAGKKGAKGKKGRDQDNGGGDMPDTKNMTHREKRMAQKMAKGDAGETKIHKKTIAQLRKEREAKEKMKVKHMKKPDRQRLERSTKRDAQERDTKRSNQMRGRTKKPRK
jgi:ATP-dependent RNA helicase DDX54/DBP10